MRELNDQQRLDIIFEMGRMKENKSQVAKRLKISIDTVRLWWRKYKSNEIEVNDADRKGRPRQTSERQDQALKEITKRFRTHSSQELATTWKSRGVEMSATTIRRRLKELGLNSLSPKKVPQLSPGNKLDRLIFAQETSQQDWTKVLYTDEATFRMDKLTHSVWREYGEEVTLDVGPRQPSVSVWGCFAKNGFGRLKIIDGAMNMQQYVDIVEDNLMPSVYELFGEDNEDWVLLEDNARYHTGHLSVQVREKYGIDRFDWPPYSPDLNPIENVWSVMKKELAKHPPKDRDEMVKKIKRVWRSFSADFAENLILSMNGRMQKCIEREGGQI